MTSVSCPLMAQRISGRETYRSAPSEVCQDGITSLENLPRHLRLDLHLAGFPDLEVDV